jgi:hypothetical protein
MVLAERLRGEQSPHSVTFTLKGQKHRLCVLFLFVFRVVSLLFILRELKLQKLHV